MMQPTREVELVSIQCEALYLLMTKERASVTSTGSCQRIASLAPSMIRFLSPECPRYAPSSWELGVVPPLDVHMAVLLMSCYSQAVSEANSLAQCGAS